MADRFPDIRPESPVAGSVLNPTQVVPGPRPVEPAEASAATLITGEVVGPRHARPSGSRHAAAGAAGLLAAGAMAGLSLLNTSQPSDVTTAREAGAAEVVPGEGSAGAPAAPAQVLAAPGDEPLQVAQIPAPAAPAQAAAAPAAPAAAPAQEGNRGRHARPDGPWDSGDWQEAVHRAVSAGQQYREETGRHRGGGRHGGGFGHGGFGHGGFGDGF
ncbi:hypothetical protein [Streptomyces sp. SCUT-3]|uniref:hypothetical protein n=1 Tax=Streptomyces sp. SCUT-3 TaxID=2684469 RepID=UPI0015FB39F0|nr:hypothetical protein [Streptomyces sp. SCUT-3]